MFWGNDGERGTQLMREVAEAVDVRMVEGDLVKLL